MAIDIKLPDLGDGIESGDILEVLVREGDVVEKDQGIVEIETEKATAEVPSSHAGRVTKVHVTKGQTVPIGATLVTIEAEEGAKPAAQPAAPAPEKEVPAPEREQTERTSGQAEKEARGEAEQAAKPDGTGRAPVDERPAPAPAPTAASEDAGEPGRLAPAGPAVRRLAREVGVSLAEVKGTGPAGRITREDVLSVVRQGAIKTAPRPTGPRAADSEHHDDWGPVTLERATRIRRTIAAKMQESWSNVPRVTNFDDADVTELERLRQASKADYAAAGIKLTAMPFVIKAAALALRHHPLLNASLDLDNEQIIYKHYINIGIAVDTERGLVVPSLRAADQMSVAEVARALAGIAEAARNGSFTLDELRGSTFTISNLGAIGGTYSTPIVNTPEVAILLVGRSRKLPVVKDDKIVARLMLPLSLSYDHRLVDGATAARFLNDVIGYLEAPSRLFLAPQ